MAEQKYHGTRVSVNHCSSARQFLEKMAQTGPLNLLDVSEQDIFWQRRDFGDFGGQLILNQSIN